MSGSPEELVFISVHVSSSAAPTLTEFVEFSPSSVWSPLIADGQHGINLPVFFNSHGVSLGPGWSQSHSPAARALTWSRHTRGGARALTRTIADKWSLATWMAARGDSKVCRGPGPMTVQKIVNWTLAPRRTFQWIQYFTQSTLIFHHIFFLKLKTFPYSNIIICCSSKFLGIFFSGTCRGW